MVEQFYNQGIIIEQVEYCPHSPKEECDCRKPKTGMIDKISQNFEIDFENSWLIGDKQSDIECANNSGIKNTIQVRSGHEFESSIANFVIDKLDFNEISRIIF
jgi:D-glycero-D-manno-heptose 1,7-bisphosphate phosphatase